MTREMEEANPWEYPARKRWPDCTYSIPLTEDMTGNKIDAVVLDFSSR